jgi:hypothetical protein
MATATKAEIEKIVRRVVNEEQDGSDEAVWKAVQRLSRLLTEQVIPKLSGQSDEADFDPNADGPVARALFAEAETADGRPGFPEGEEPPAGDIPQPVSEAFEELYKALTPEQASALASFFTAFGDRGEGEDTEPDPHSA